MAKETKTQTATFTDTVKGSNSTEPSRMDGWEYVFPTVPFNADLEAAVEFLNDRNPADDDTPVVEFIRSAWEDYCKASRKAHHNGKDGRGKDVPQRSETLTKEEVAEFAQSLTLPAPKITKDQEVERTRAQLNAMQEALIGTLADYPKAKREEKITEWKTAGLIPDDYTFEG